MKNTLDLDDNLLIEVTTLARRRTTLQALAESVLHREIRPFTRQVARASDRARVVHH